MEHLIQDLIILLLVSLPINIVFHKYKMPSIVGFLVAGLIIGPNGLQLIEDSESVKHLAEIGVILLLFVIGLEFSLNHLLKNLVRILGVGSLQMLLTAVAVFLVSRGMGLSVNVSVVMGLFVALSSTTIVLKMITDRAEIDTLHGRISIGVLLFQDLCVVPMMLIVPLLSQAGGGSTVDFVMAILKSLAAVAGIFFLSRLIVPRSLGFIAQMGSKEHLTLLVILIILGTGWVSQNLGLSLAMGAFIAGMIISESEYSHQIVLDILPLKDYFGSIFFISVGMLLQIQTFMDSPLVYLGLAAGVMLAKTVVTIVAALIMKNSFRNSFIVGLRLAQVGEFSLLLASLALDQALFSEALYQSFLIVSLLTMLAAPLLIQFSASLALKLPFQFGAPSKEELENGKKDALYGHVIIAGYGLIGRNLSRVLKETNIPFQIVELDGEKLKQALTEDMPAIYGDFNHRDTLTIAGIGKAKMMVISVKDFFAAQQGVRLARQLNPDIYILVRTNFASEVEELHAAGADQVIPEEFETSVEIFSRALREFGVSNNVIEQQVELIRMEGYGMFRGLSLSTESLGKFSAYLAESLTDSFHILDNSWGRQKSIKELDLQGRTGAKLFAVVRNNELQANPNDEFRLRNADILILFGRHEQLARSKKILQSGPEAV